MARMGEWVVKNLVVEPEIEWDLNQLVGNMDPGRENPGGILGKGDFVWEVTADPSQETKIEVEGIEGGDY